MVDEVSRFYLIPNGEDRIPKGRILKEDGNFFEPTGNCEDENFEKVQFLTPKQIHRILDKNVFGNSGLKIKLSISLSNLIAKINFPDLEIPKSNILILGDTGTGKTFLIDTLSKISNVPLIRTNLTGLSSVGYVGGSIKDVFSDLTDEYYFPINNANYAIVHLDEIDKIAGDGQKGGFSKSLQNELIGYIENCEIQGDEISTKDMLFIGTGAFSGLEEIISLRLKKQNSNLGFTSNFSKVKKSERLNQVTHEDLIEYGLKPELVGRFPLIGNTSNLNEDSMISILNLDSSYLSSKIKIFQDLHGIDVNLTNDAKQEIAIRAKKIGSNARALQGLVDKVFEKIEYSPLECGKEVIFNKQYVEEILD